MRETLEQMVARINAGAFIPNENTGDLIMAKAVKLAKGKEFTFKAAGTGGGVTKYPWDTWFNGDLLLLERDETEDTGEKDDKGTPKLKVTAKKDYDVDTNAMPAKLKTAARKRYKVVQISRLDADGKKLQNSLIIRARDMTTEERQAEDVLRAEEKEARQAEKAEPAPQAPALHAATA